MIIIEGADGNGKSTLGRELSLLMGIDFVKPYKPRRDQLKFYLTSYNNFKHNILDRYYLSEFVYPYLKKKEKRKKLLFWQQHMVERILVPLPSILILCETSISINKENLASRGDDYIEVGELPSLRHLYSIFFDNSILPKIRFDYKVDNVQDLISFIHRAYSSRLHASFGLRNFCSIGSIFDKGKVLLVGDRPSSFIMGKLPYTPPAFSSYSHSSLYLHEALYYTGDHGNFIITNTKEDDLLFREEVRFYKPGRIVALGNKAGIYLDNLGFRAKKIRHPQFMKRFYNLDIYDFSLRISNIEI